MRGGRLIFLSWVALALNGCAIVFGTPGERRVAESGTGCNDDCARELYRLDQELELAEADRDVAARAAKAFERRHYLGFQMGGPAALQLTYRLRMVDRLHVDVGSYAGPGAFNGSAGLLFDFPMSTRTSPYVSAGGGFLGAAGEHEPCDSDPQCVESTIRLFVYFRAGVSVRLGSERRDVLGFDVGLWRGASTDDGPSGVVREETFLWPMAGFSYHYAL
jgi:hypothetical protein